MSEDCHFCDQESPIEQHHIVPRRFGGSDKEENLVSVCSNCHNKLEKLYNKRFYNQLGISKDRNNDLAKWKCEYCERYFAETMGVIPDCPVCGEETEISFISELSSLYSELADPEAWTEKKLNKGKIVWFKNKSRDDVFTYPKGNNPKVFDNKVEAHEKVGELVIKDIVSDAGIFSFESFEDLNSPEIRPDLIKEVFGDDLTNKPKAKVYENIVEATRGGDFFASKNWIVRRSELGEDKTVDLINELSREAEIFIKESDKICLIDGDAFDHKIDEEEWKRHKVSRTVKDIQEEMNSKEGVSKSNVKEKCQEIHGLGEEEVENLINELKRQGKLSELEPQKVQLI